MRPVRALMICLLLSGFTLSVVQADPVPGSDAAERVGQESGQPLDTDNGPATDMPARPSLSLGVVAILAMSVLIFVYLRRKHALPPESPTGTRS